MHVYKGISTMLLLARLISQDMCKLAQTSELSEKNIGSFG